jgi:hypothetical protein
LGYRVRGRLGEARCRTQAIRARVAKHPGMDPHRIVEFLAARDIRVSPARVIVVQTLRRSERSEQVSTASASRMVPAATT